MTHRNQRNQRRRDERKALSNRLKVWLESYARKYCSEYDDALCLDFAQVVDKFAAEPPRMRHFLQYVAYREAECLVDDYQWSRGRRRPAMPVTPTALNILRIWAPLYLNWAAANAKAGSGPVPTSPWPPQPEGLDQQLSAIMLRKPGWAREWQEYYNAACTFAVALGGWSKLSDEKSQQTRKQLALHAVRYLERAVSCSDSSYVGTYAQWLATGDQDLNPLRSTSEFADYLDRYLPNDEPRVPCPTELLRLIMSLHTIRLLQRYAKLRADYWDRERRRDDTDASECRQELDRETEVRAIARQYALNDRDWHSRRDLIDEADSFARCHQLPACGSALPHFQDDPAVHRYVVDGPRVEGTQLDEYYDKIVSKRNDQWHAVLTRLSEQAADEGVRPNDSITPDSAMWFWRRVEVTLQAALDEQA